MLYRLYVQVTLKAKLSACCGKYRITEAKLPRQNARRPSDLKYSLMGQCFSSTVEIEFLLFMARSCISNCYMPLHHLSSTKPYFRERINRQEASNLPNRAKPKMQSVELFDVRSVLKSEAKNRTRCIQVMKAWCGI